MSDCILAKIRQTYDETVKEGSSIVGQRRPSLKYPQANQWVLCNILFVKNESHQASGPEDKWDKRSPMVPRVHDASPRQSNKERGGRGNEYERARPVDPCNLFHERRVDVL